MKPKTKTISLHYKRRRADSHCDLLQDGLEESFRHGDSNVWRAVNHVPSWTQGFVVKRARTRFHYKVVAVSA